MWRFLFLLWFSFLLLLKWEGKRVSCCVSVIRPACSRRFSHTSDRFIWSKSETTRGLTLTCQCHGPWFHFEAICLSRPTDNGHWSTVNGHRAGMAYTWNLDLWFKPPIATTNCYVLNLLAFFVWGGLTYPQPSHDHYHHYPSISLRHIYSDLLLIHPTSFVHRT